MPAVYIYAYGLSVVRHLIYSLDGNKTILFVSKENKKPQKITEEPCVHFYRIENKSQWNNKPEISSRVI